MKYRKQIQHIRKYKSGRWTCVNRGIHYKRKKANPTELYRILITTRSFGSMPEQDILVEENMLKFNIDLFKSLSQEKQFNRISHLQSQIYKLQKEIEVWKKKKMTPERKEFIKSTIKELEHMVGESLFLLKMYMGEYKGK